MLLALVGANFIILSVWHTPYRQRQPVTLAEILIHLLGWLLVGAATDNPGRYPSGGAARRHLPQHLPRLFLSQEVGHLAKLLQRLFLFANQRCRAVQGA